MNAPTQVSENPSGAHFHRCALQVNPHHYSSTFRGQNTDGNATEYAAEIIEEALDLDISVIAITDHNSASDFPAFRDAAKGTSITVFPGFELSSSEGIHILCMYSPETDEEQLGRFLGEFGIRRPGPSIDLSSDSFEDILMKVREQGGITIAAHVTGKKGLFDVLEGQARIRAWRSDDLHAIQIPGAVNDLPNDVRPIVQNKNPDYQRVHATGESQALAVVNSMDVAKPQDLADPSATCWIKMSEISIEGLRQAFLDPDSRIRLNSDPELEEHTELSTVTWEGGFLDGTSVHLNPNLNVLIGGRGAGKSTVVESLRHVLELEPIGEEARKAHDGMVRQVLRSGTKVSVRVRAYRPMMREYLIERTIPNPPVVREENGQISNLTPEDILPRVEIYGQHEISELAGSPDKLTMLLDRFVEQDESLGRRKDSVSRGLAQTRKTILDSRSELKEIDEQLARLPSLEETLLRYQEAGLEDRLRDRSLLVSEEQVLDTVPKRIEEFRKSLDSLKQELPIDRAFLAPEALAELPGKKILADAGPVLDALSQKLELAADSIDDALKQAQQELDSIHSRWSKRQQGVEAEYQKILRELQKSAVDGEEFIRLRSEIEDLNPLRERSIDLKGTEEKQKARRIELLADWEEIKAEHFRLLDRAARTVSGRLANRVRVEVTAAGNREPLYKALREEVGGRLSEAIDQLRNSPDLSLPEFVKCCREGAETISKTYSIPLAQAERLSRATPQSIMRFEELELTPTTVVMLNTASVGDLPDWKALEDLSKGQKATAVLLLLLLESDAPLIVDQPEDDLDNRFITDGVVPKMRDGKRRRQFIFSTHNANIPVLGDAELILGLTAAGEAEKGTAAIRPEHVGSIDSRQVRELVEEILEGGKEAFERRRMKYGF